MNEFKKTTNVKKIDRRIGREFDLDRLAMPIRDIAEEIKKHFPFEANQLQNIAKDMKVELEYRAASLTGIAEQIRINFPFQANTLGNIAQKLTDVIKK